MSCCTRDSLGAISSFLCIREKPYFLLFKAAIKCTVEGQSQKSSQFSPSISTNTQNLLSSFSNQTAKISKKIMNKRWTPHECSYTKISSKLITHNLRFNLLGESVPATTNSRHNTHTRYRSEYAHTYELGSTVTNNFKPFQAAGEKERK